MTSSNAVQIACFSESMPGTATPTLAAAVAWRGVPAPAALLGGGGPLGWLRGLRHLLWLQLGPLGIDLGIAGRPLFGGRALATRHVGSVGHMSLSAPLAYYDDGSRVLRLLGRAVAAPPPGETLVALVDASGRHRTAPRLVLRRVRTSPASMSFAPPTEAGEGSAILVGEDPTWAAALRTDPVVRSFLDGTDTR